MDCPFCPSGHDFGNRRRPRISVWAPLALIVAVLGTAALASAMSDNRDPIARQSAPLFQGRAL
jgi:hypothetical protein